MAETQRPRVLLVEDTPDLAGLYCKFLEDEPIEMDHVETGEAALAKLRESPPAVILLDLKLPDMDGQAILRYVAESGLPTTVLVMTAHGGVDTAVEVMREGACDFLMKPFRAERLVRTLRNILARNALVPPGDGAAGTAAGDGHFHGLIGESAPMHRVHKKILSAARSQAPVFISGESGTGKELCAQAIHDSGPRSKHPMIAINCAAIPRELMESEVFGHARGAFTGATGSRAGAARLAHGGTLLLDEICEMDLALQSKLLRFVETGSYRPVGSDRQETVDVRLLCATNRNPQEEIRAGRFREDLYYRLNVISLHLPPLRAHKDDILPLARYFLEQCSREEGKNFVTFAPEVEQALLAFDWPGNVRQLRNAIRSIVVLHDGERVEPSMLPPSLFDVGRLTVLKNEPAPQTNSIEASIRPLHEVERAAIEAAIARCDGNIAQAAEL
ncbi:MAG TPA: sigma-54 dependent transcriptional regulator, partial [Kiloniellales bacterium]|nr:sigma-54 dependent transcriptional regulator [Kiloniellales bacterium]